MPRRIKACAICRQKRIKCDATMPECLMCIRFKRKCPGPTDAPLLFIDNSSYPSGKKPRKKNNVPKPEAERYELVVNEACAVVEQDLRELPVELAFVKTAHISPHHIQGEAFFANMVRYFCAEGRHIPGPARKMPAWLYALPRLATVTQEGRKSSPNEALSLSLRATAAAFCGIEMGHLPLLEFACGLYGSALRSQAYHLASSDRTGRDREGKGANISMLSASVILSMFEGIVSTTGQAYAEHVVGAAKMSDTVLAQSQKRGSDGHPGSGGQRSPGGPDFLLINLFIHNRIQLMYVYLTSTDYRVLHDDVMDRVLIRTCGLNIVKLPLDQQVITPLARLVRLLLPTNDLNSIKEKDKKEWWLEEYETAKEEISGLWKGYTESTKGQTLLWKNIATGHTDFRDPFTAMQYAYFSACWILLDIASCARHPRGDSPHDYPRESSRSISPSSAGSGPSELPIRNSPPLSKTSPTDSTPLSSNTTSPPQWQSSSNRPTTSPHTASPPQATETQTMVPADHFTLILSVTWFMRLRDIGFSYLRLHVPLFVVAKYAPRIEQRRIARFMFEEWRVGTLRGVGQLAIDKLDDDSKLMRRMGH